MKRKSATGQIRKFGRFRKIRRNRCDCLQTLSRHCAACTLRRRRGYASHK